MTRDTIPVLRASILAAMAEAETAAEVALLAESPAEAIACVLHIRRLRYLLGHVPRCPGEPRRERTYADPIERALAAAVREWVEARSVPVGSP